MAAGDLTSSETAARAMPFWSLAVCYTAIPCHPPAATQRLLGNMLAQTRTAQIAGRGLRPRATVMLARPRQLAARAGGQAVEVQIQQELVRWVRSTPR